MVWIIQLAFSEVTFLEDLTWATLILLLKGKGGYRGIRLVEVMWKVFVVVVNIWLKRDVDLHETFHRFQERRITGTATLEKIWHNRWP